MKNGSSRTLEENFPTFISVELNLPPDQTPAFFPLLQKGVRLKARIGSSVMDFLSDHLGLSPEYVRERVKTIFLDGRSVDDLEATRIRNGSSLAISAAMPGLAGAVLRRGSFFAGLRSRVEEQRQGPEDEREEGLVHLRLFNLLLPEVGPLLLRKGILISKDEFLEFWGSFSGESRQTRAKARVNGKECEMQFLAHLLRENPSPCIRLEVNEKK